jgi:hypothetical protein
MTVVYMLLWVFSVQHPSGEVTNRVHQLGTGGRVRLEHAECQRKASELNAKLPVEKVTTEDGGKATFSWFFCAKLPADPSP